WRSRGRTRPVDPACRFARSQRPAVGMAGMREALLPGWVLGVVVLARGPAVALVRPGFASSFFERAERLLSGVARRRGLAVLTGGATALGRRWHRHTSN